MGEKLTLKWGLESEEEMLPSGLFWFAGSCEQCLSFKFQKTVGKFLSI
jgi:hypothetical protein